MTDPVETLSMRRRIILMLLASSYLIWQVPSMDWVRGPETGARRLADNLADLGQLGFVIAMVALLYTGRKLFPRASKSTQAALEDDLVKSNRLAATKFGYIALMIASIILFLISGYMELNGRDVARLLLAIGVAVPIYSFVILERVNA